MAAFSRSVDDGIGFGKIVALGNRVDLNETDLLDFLVQDPETRVVAMMLESFADGRRFFETAVVVAKKKPLVVLKTGRHPGARRAAASHTAALSSDEAVVSAALRRAGAHLVEDGKTLLDVASALDRQPPLRG
jgi:acyl-CoA synthetase (NDP forming)